MTDCEKCKHAVWDYEEYYGGQQRWFVSDCKKDWPFWLKEDCEDYEEWESLLSADKGDIDG